MSEHDRNDGKKRGWNLAAVEGKAKTPLSLRYNTEDILLPGESREEYEALVDRLLREHQPQGFAETTLVEQLAYNMWRWNRATALETALLSGLAASVPGPLSPAAKAARGLMAAVASRKKAFDHFQCYGEHVRRMYFETLKQLRAAQSARLRNEAAAAKARARAERARERAEKAASRKPKEKEEQIVEIPDSPSRMIH